MRAFVWADACTFDVHGRPHSDVVARRLRSKHLERPLEKPRVVAAVVDDRVAVLPLVAEVVRELVGLDEVSPPHLRAFETDLSRDAVEGSLHHEACVWPARPAIG